MAPPQIAASNAAFHQPFRRDSEISVAHDDRRLTYTNSLSSSSLSPEDQIPSPPQQAQQPLQNHGAAGHPWRLWHEVSGDYMEDAPAPLDPPTKLIENFLQKQAASGDVCLDMDVGMMEKLPSVAMAQESSLLLISPINEAAAYEEKEGEEAVQQRSAQQPSQESCLHSVSFTTEQPTQVGLNGCDGNEAVDAAAEAGDHSDDDASSSEDEAEIQRRRRGATSCALHRAQTRSRLADDETRSHQDPRITIKPTVQQQQNSDEEDDDIPDDDIPEEFRGRSNWKKTLSAAAALQWAAFIAIMAWLVCSLTVPELKGRPLWSMALWKWALLVLLIFCGRLVSGWAVAAAVAAMERSFLLRRRVLYFVYALRKGFQNTIWFAFALLAWRLVFDPKAESAAGNGGAASVVLPYVTKTLSCLLIAAVVWLVKIFLVKTLASSFHVSTYFERIRESLFAQWVLETLSGPPAMEVEEEKAVMSELEGLRRHARAKLPASILSSPPPPPPPKKKKKSGSVGKSGVISAGKSSGLVMKSGYVGKSGVISAGKSSGLVMKSGYVGKSGLVMKSGYVGVLPQPTADAAENDGSAGGGAAGITIDHLRRLNRNNVSAWNMKRLMKVVRYRGVCTLAHVIDQSSTAGGEDAAADVEIQSAWQAKAAAKTIFRNVAKPGARYIERNDLRRFMQAAEVEKALPLFDGARESGRISKASLKNFAVHVVRERRALAVSLTDTKTAVKKLHRIVDVVVGVIILIIWLLVLGLATTHLLLVVSSQLVLVVFVVGNTCKNVFEAIVFLFVMHPFDVGDRCVVDGNQVVVEEMNILSTLFMKGDGERVWYPNSLLATKYIFNYSRTPDNGDSFEFSIDASTPSDKITQLKDKISKYIARKPNLWMESHHLTVKSIEDDNKMTMRLDVNHTINYNEDVERRIRKSDLILDVKKMLQELEIGYRLLPQQVHVSYMPMEPICQKEGRNSHLKMM